jgi:ferric-dicitrate binding protein FerR (iron transport regulator)
MKKELSPELIRKYLAGECSPQERQLVDEWYDSFEHQDGLVDSLNEQQQQDLKMRMLGTVKTDIRRQTKYAGHLHTPLALYVRIAAMLVLMAGLAFFFISNFTSDGPGSGQREVAGKVVSMKATANHQKAIRKVTLSDGSTIWLSAHSTIRHPEIFKADIREVYLEGEAFFDVKRDSLRPFVIYSSHVTTRVLGTSFTISAYTQNPGIEVSVVTGKVAVSVNSASEHENNGEKAQTPAEHTPASLVLLPNEKATFSKADLSLQREVIDPLPKKSLWAPASLSFQDTPIRQVVKELNRRFDAEITVTDEAINNCTIRADFTSQHLPLIIELICKSIDADYRIIDKKISISGEGCTSN